MIYKQHKFEEEITRCCNKCGIVLGETEFSKAGFKNGVQLYRNTCKPCFNMKNQIIRNRLQEQVDDYKKNTECLHCGFSDPRAFQFHHISREDKDFGISEGVRDKKSFPIILKEIGKCMVLCANCHQILHYEERNNAEMVE
tara:strand:- start:412 stop:834 length:423 start_codon:yes stop_codon:yes gene_type:complete